ncbi:MAG: hypothetical protein EAZ55_02800 [Cytophagales bacterium]|nr:MAG: hypothetical protein EAZ55_02800 [Cytophagales bacterium]
MKNLFLFAFVLTFLTACGGKTTTKVDKFDISIDLPSGWSVATTTYGDEVTAEISTKKRRAIEIVKANPTVESLEMLEKASKGTLEVLSKETFDKGFGLVYKEKGKKKFVIYATVNGTQYRCSAGAYYKEEDFSKGLEIAKSIK